LGRVIGKVKNRNHLLTTNERGSGVSIQFNLTRKENEKKHKRYPVRGDSSRKGAHSTEKESKRGEEIEYVYGIQ